MNEFDDKSIEQIEEPEYTTLNLGPTHPGA